MDRRSELIEHYFFLGFQQNEIIALLDGAHSIKIHPRTLKRILFKRKLYRRKNFTDYHIVLNFIGNQLAISGQLHGYRWMHLKCLQNGLVVTQNVVRRALSLLDPEGVNCRIRKRLRRRRYINEGPNAIWHMDSYDKLKRYGICINGAIDGFSRFIIWLHAGRTSSDPKVIAGYYVGAIRRFGGCPRTIRADMGTENGTVEVIQLALCHEFGTRVASRPPFIYGRSTGNQRIESWWSHLRKENTQFWINFFEELEEEGMFNGSRIDKCLILFCFLHIIQDELNTVVRVWNAHRIRGTKRNRLITGRPLMMFRAPHLFGVETKLISILEETISRLEDECTFYADPCDHYVFQLCRSVALDNNLPLQTSDPYDAAKLYIELRTIIYQLLNEN